MLRRWRLTPLRVGGIRAHREALLSASPRLELTYLNMYAMSSLALIYERSLGDASSFAPCEPPPRPGFSSIWSILELKETPVLVCFML